MDNRMDLRETFEQAALRYHRARPRYPQALLDRLADVRAVAPETTALEVGPATGVATEQLAPIVGSICALELGPQLAAQAEVNVERFPHVSITHGSFDSWQPDEWHAFNLVFAATSWHWLDPKTKYQRAHRHLAPGGYLAFWSANHVIPVQGDPFFHQIQETYDKIGEGRRANWQPCRPGELPDQRREIEASDCFEVVAVDHFDWEVVYTADAYIDLLMTFSSHIAMGPSQQSALFDRIRELLAQRPSATLRRHWGAVLHVAKAKPAGHG